MKDYYAILGISPNAEPEVIGAAYKSLAKKYHPDIYKGTKKDAEVRIREINEAYSTLSNKSKKTKYDEEFLKNKSAGNFNEFNNSEFNDNENIFADDWNILIEVFPNAEKLRLELSKLSQKLSFLFQVILLEKKLGGKAHQVAQNLKNEFLERYFGNNKSIQILASKALQNDEIEIAKEINKKIILLGDDAASKIYSSLSSKLEKNIRQKKSTQSSNFNKNNNDYKPKSPKKTKKNPIIYIGPIVIFLTMYLLIEMNTSTDSFRTTCTQEPSKCNNTQLCEISTEFVNGKRIWNEGVMKWVMAAKSRGLNCNVGYSF